MFWKNKSEFEFSIDENYLKELSADEAKFYMELAEKQLQDSIDTGNIITERSTNLLNLALGILIALVAFCITRGEEKKEIDYLIKMALWGCSPLLIVIILLIAATFPKTYCIPGVNPKIIFDKKLFHEKYDTEKRQRNLAIIQIENYEKSIMENTQRNKDRWMQYKIALFIFFAAPILFGIYFLIIKA